MIDKFTLKNKQTPQISQKRLRPTNKKQLKQNPPKPQKKPTQSPPVLLRQWYKLILLQHLIFGTQYFRKKFFCWMLTFLSSYTKDIDAIFPKEGTFARKLWRWIPDSSILSPAEDQLLKIWLFRYSQQRMKLLPVAGRLGRNNTRWNQHPFPAGPMVNMILYRSLSISI